MSTLFFLIEQWATGLYFLIGGLILYFWWRLARAQRQVRSTHFELERDLARYERSNLLTAMLLLVEAGLIIIGVQRVVAPHLRQVMDVPLLVAQVQEDGTFYTPTPAPVLGEFAIDSSGVQLGEVNAADQILPTPTITPTPVGTLVPNSPAPIGCDTEYAWLEVPANGMIVFEPAVVRGVAWFPDFAFYRFELRGPSTGDEFAVLPGNSDQAVQTVGDLGQFVPAFYTPGEYQFRLSVFDQTQMSRASCAMTIYISAPIPSATPLPTIAAP